MSKLTAKQNIQAIVAAIKVEEPSSIIFMPTTSIFDRDLASRQASEKGLLDHTERTLFLMRGTDLSGANDFRVRR